VAWTCSLGYHYLDLVPKGRDEEGLAYNQAWVTVGIPSERGDHFPGSFWVLRALAIGSGMRFADRGEHVFKAFPRKWRLCAFAG
jgi:hypothetical protein